jgi:hypothetical protein
VTAGSHHSRMHLVITSSLSDQDLAQSYQYGASAVLSKPPSRGKLARRAGPDWEKDQDVRKRGGIIQ